MPIFFLALITKYGEEKHGWGLESLNLIQPNQFWFSFSIYPLLHLLKKKKGILQPKR